MIGVARRNPRFARLWSAQVVSQTGDWFNRVAVIALLAKLAGPSAAVGVGLSFGLEMAVRMLPTAFMSPFAGTLADRFSRKGLMIGCDLARIPIVLCYLTVDEPSEVGRLYLLLALQMGLGICFDAARQGALPNTVGRDDLHDALALSSVTWSMMLSIGALVGGAAIGPLGIAGVFVVDACTYAVSASLLAGLRLPTAPPHPTPFRWIDLLTLREARLGLVHVRERRILAALATKALWGPAGAFLVMVSVAASVRFGLGDNGLPDPARIGPAFGLLFAARGVGTAIGPILGRYAVGRGRTAMLQQIAIGFVIAAIGYALFAFAQGLWLAALCVVLAHVGGGAIWVASTSFWQQSVDDRFRGRVHALDFLGMTVSFSVFALLGGLVYDASQSIELTMACGLGALALCATTWFLATRPIARELATAPVAGAAGASDRN
ncbi:MFS transporter [Engelhardtia mirabilis]|uniref:2-acyl-glycerophospho-ethanolamine acyltransferase n=1 Tax=Engelhardtia mirabilis TaxID=2528011 RepID=A0A518BF47_9BACT|nr:2-acyl-glycerophospho-ethanolamine acyltransferase [Planctomycetes bacterium Pla133]QDU99930.1 2-acyl-glycerophospho-ethanolamine acyltransferase [Planctomycetes bacterium Pla86]